MPTLKLTLTYEYEANPDSYFPEVPVPLTPEHLEEMAAIDSDPDNIRDFLHYIMETDDYVAVIEVVE